MRLFLIESSEALAKPSSDPWDIAALPCRRLPRCPRFEMLQMRRLRVDQQPRGGGKSRSLGLLGQAGNAERAPDAHRTAENLRRQPGEPGELAPPARENPGT